MKQNLIIGLLILLVLSPLIVPISMSKITSKDEVVQIYINYLLEHSPCWYFDSASGTVVSEWGDGAAPAAFTIEALLMAYRDPGFKNQKALILDKIIFLANYILTEQNTDPSTYAYGGFRSTDSSTWYYSIDAGRVLPALLKTYQLTGNLSYLDSARNAVNFLYMMQHKPAQLSLMDAYYGGFAQVVTSCNAWVTRMYVVDLYLIVGLQEYFDLTQNSTVLSMINDAVSFLGTGFQQCALYFNPKPYGDNLWHRCGNGERFVFEDDYGYALHGMYHYEGYSARVRNVYEFLNNITAPSYPNYDPKIAWAGYKDVVSQIVAVNYYDIVSMGILGDLRKSHDHEAYDLGMSIITNQPKAFLYWGLNCDLVPTTSWQSTITAAWISQLLLTKRK
jgi:hypothetical protein